MNYCYHCLNKLDDGIDICPRCGCDQSVYVTPPHILAPGTLVNNRYLVGGILGEGGFGITYIGLDTLLDYHVAVKEFFPNGMVTRNSTVSTDVVTISTGTNHDFFFKSRENFLREARTLAKYTKEEGVVSVRDFFEANNTVYIVMEYIDGVTLKRYLNQSGGKLPWRDAVRLLMPVLKILAKIHSDGLIHRDISPDNIMLADGGVKLLDFGAARDYTDEKSLSVMLKHGYAPMEQYRRHGEQGTWTDVYAFCATLYKCVTGNAPPDAPDRIFNDTLRMPSELGMEVSPTFEEVLRRGLAVRNDERIQTAGELMSGLQAALADNGTANAYNAQNNADRAYRGAPAGAADLRQAQARQPSPVQMNRGAPRKAEQTETVQMNRSVPRQAERPAPVQAAAPAYANQPVPAAAVKGRKPLHPVLIGVIAVFSLFWLIVIIMVIMTKAEEKKEAAAAGTAVIEAEEQSAEVTVADEPAEPAAVTTAEKVMSGVSSVTGISWRIENDDTLIISGSGDMGETELFGDVVPAKSKIRKVIIENGVTSIYDKAFYNFSGLESVTIPETVTSIGESAFDSCISLKSADIPDSVTSIGGWAFASCKSLESATISKNVTIIERNTFAECSSLKKVKIPSGVTKVGVRAFAWCEALTSVTIPNSVSEFGNKAFENCTSLTIKCNKGSAAEKYADENGITYDNGEKTVTKSADTTAAVNEALADGFEISLKNGENVLKYYRGEGGDVVIPGGVTCIGDSVFYANTSLTSVVIPNGVTRIGDYAFELCKSLTSITIPDGVTYIGIGAFKGCKSLKSVNIPNSVTSIESQTFEDCANLTSITIPKSVKTIGDGDDPFAHCPNITIKCSKDSAAERYAIFYDKKYELID